MSADHVFANNPLCRLLGIRRGIIALTKSDLVDEDILGLVRLEVEEMVAGSFLQGAPIVPVSSVTSAGLDHLRAELAAASSTSFPQGCHSYTTTSGRYANRSPGERENVVDKLSTTFRHAAERAIKSPAFDRRGFRIAIQCVDASAGVLIRP